MQGYEKNRDCSQSVLLVMFGLILIGTSCRYSNSVKDNQQVRMELNKVSGAEAAAIYINYRSFQNSDNTWGFTVFVNSVPFRHYNRIPYRRSSTGFITREEAEQVANLFIGMINKGNYSPKLDKTLIDSLDITIK